MSFTEFERKKVEKLVDAFIEKHRPPPSIRDKVDLGYRLKDQSVEIFEIRPAWQAPQEKIESPVAKATYVKSKQVWKVYWQRADLKWRSYDPMPEVKNLEEFLAVVAQDEYGCFFG